MNSERGFESGRPRTESAREESHQSVRAQEAASKARPQESSEKTEAAINATRRQLAKEADVPILAIVLPVAEQPTPRVLDEAPDAVDIAARVVQRIIKAVAKAAKTATRITRGAFIRAEKKAV